jgi:preprotein translocase subunit YajC
MELVFPLLILFMIGLLFMSSRQRKKQQQQHDQLTQSLAVGDVVVMTSGISGTIVDVDDEKTVDVEIAEDVVTTWLRAAVREKLVEEPEAGDDSPASAEAGVGTDAITRAEAPADDAVGGTPTGPSRSS